MPKAVKRRLEAQGLTELVGRDLQDRPYGVRVNKRQLLDWGKQCQVFAGIDSDDNPVAVKRLSYLAPTKRGSWRQILRCEQQGYDDTSLPKQVRQEVATMTALKSPLGPHAVFHTFRHKQLSKTFLVMPPMPGDVLDLVHALEGASPDVRCTAAVIVVRQLLEQLVLGHQQQIMHGDMRAENMLCEMLHGLPHIVLADFGKAASGADAMAMASDLYGLGKITLMLLLPENRGRLEDLHSLALAHERTIEQFDAWKEVLEQLLNPVQDRTGDATVATLEKAYHLTPPMSEADPAVKRLFAGLLSKKHQIDASAGLARSAANIPWACAPPAADSFWSRVFDYGMWLLG